MAESADPRFRWFARTQGGTRSRTRAGLRALTSSLLISSAVVPIWLVPPAEAATAWAVSASYSAATATLTDTTCPTSDECIAVGYSGGGGSYGGAVVESTTTGGATWVSDAVPASVATSTGLTAIACPTSTVCYAGGYSSTLGTVVLVTSDGGTSWTVQDGLSGEGFYSLACPSTSDCYGVAYTNGNGNVVWATTTGGSTWSSLPIPSTPSVLEGVTCVSVETCFVVGGGDVLKTTDGGTTWTTDQLWPLPGAGDLDSVFCASATTCYAGAYGGAISTTTDAGATWTSQSVNLNVDSIACSSVSDCYAGGNQGGSVATLFGTVDGGGVWTAQALPEGGGYLGGLSCSDATTCFALESTSFPSQSLILSGPGSPAPPRAATTTRVTASPSPVTAGQSVTYSATVQAASGTGTPTGSVTFSTPTGTLCVATLNGGGGSCLASNAPAGDDTVTGVYSGDSSFLGSTTTTSLVVKAQSVTEVEVDPDGTPLGQPVTYSASVATSTGTAIGSPSLPVPTGTVTFTVGSTELCVATLADGTGNQGGPVFGTGSCVASNAPVGHETVTGTYSGDGDTVGSSGSATLVVGETTTTVTASPSSVPVGGSVTYSSTVTGVGSASSPTGTVSLSIGATQLCVITLSDGSGSCASSTAPVGDDTVTGTYSGDQNFATSSGSAGLVVGGTTTTVSAEPGTVALGQSVTYSATVAAVVGPGTPTGSVTFETGNTSLCTAVLAGGTASCSSSVAPPGSDFVTGIYSGDPNFVPSSGSTSLIVGPTSTVISVSPSSVPWNQPVSYSATVTSVLGTGTPTGSVTFVVGPVQVCVAKLTDGTGSCSASVAPAGNDTVVGTYSGDASFGSSSGTTSLVVAATTTTVSVNPTAVAYGQTVTYTAAVATTSGSGTPSGSVTFWVGTTSLCTAPLSAGAASCSASNAPGGTDPVVGIYSGDADFAGSSGSAILTVGPTETTVSVDPTSVPAGADVTYSATVAPLQDATGVPTGSVAFSTDGYPLCTAQLMNGTGSCETVSTGGPGSDPVVATYSGDATFAGSSGSTTLTETPDPSQTVLSYIVEFEHTVEFNALVSGGTYGVPASGSVTFTVGATALCTASLVYDQGASCVANNVPFGNSTVTATYSGNSDFLSSSESLPLFVASAATISVVPDHAAPGQAVTYSAVVSSPTNSGTPSGTVTFSLSGNGSPVCAAALVGGAGSCSTTAGSDGTYTVAGNYSGDSVFSGSVGWTTFQVDPTTAVATSVSVQSKSNPTWAGSTVTYTATVSPVPDGGTVTFTDNAKPIPACQARSLSATGSATCTASNTAAGTHAIMAAYSGTAGYRASDGSLTETVLTPPACPTRVSHLAAGERWAIAATTITIDNRPCAGYWVVTRSGGVTAIGAAPWLGDMSSYKLKAPMIGIASTADHRGYYLLGADGGIFTFGDAHFYGSTGNQRLAAPVVAMAENPDGSGYWLAARDGGTFAFGHAHFYGSTGNLRLKQPIVGMSADPTTGGYWLVAADGGAFAFHAPFYGSAGGVRLDQPTVGMTAQPDGHGYRLVAGDGGVFDFGDARYYGSLPARGVQDPEITTMAPSVDGNGYYLINGNGTIWSFGDAPNLGSA